MYFNCAHVNRATILSECLEDMGSETKRSAAASAGRSPNFGEEGREVRR
jgi:hypothetical protein